MGIYDQRGSRYFYSWLGIIGMADNSHFLFCDEMQGYFEDLMRDNYWHSVSRHLTESSIKP